MSESMDLQAENFQQLNYLGQMLSLLSNMNKNIALIKEGTIGQVLQVTNANLFQLAAQYYGDATRWTAIAQANGLVDPVIEATIDLTLSGQLLAIGGFVASQQTITTTITYPSAQTVIYTYNLVSSDTLNTIAKNISALIPGASVLNNTITLPVFTAINFQVSRFFNLVIPQSATDQGGILQQ